MLPPVRRPASHVFEPPDLSQTRIDAAFGNRAQRIQGLTPARAVHRGRAPPAWLDVQAALAGRRPTCASSPEFREGPEGFADTAAEVKRIRILGPAPGISAARRSENFKLLMKISGDSAA
jgi:hypothetical protein